MNYYLFFYLLPLYLTCITSLLIGFIALNKAGRNKIIWLFVTFSFSISGWSLSQALMSTASNPDTALLFGRILHASIIVIICAYIYLVYSLLEIEKEKNNKKVLIFSLIINIVFLMLMPFKIFIPSVRYTASIHYMVNPGPAYHIFCIFFAILVILGLYKLHHGYKQSKGIKQNQLRYLFWATLIGFSAASSNYLYVYDKTIPIINPYAAFGVPIYVLIITYSIFKHRLMSINLIIRKTLIYGITYTLCLSIFSFIVILLGQLIISGSIDKRVFSLSMLAVFIIVSIVKPLDKLLTTLTDKFLFRQEYEYHQILKTASLGMISIRKLDKLLNLIITIITKHVRVKHASIFLLNKETNTYIIEASKGKLKIPKHLLKFNQQKSFIRYLNKTKSPIVCEELKLLAKQQTEVNPYVYNLRLD
ncbi:MAG: histidine kinase N-terminal 7TM domain-containing protein [Candidatus Omnitrophota bacterium]